MPEIVDLLMHASATLAELQRVGTEQSVVAASQTQQFGSILTALNASSVTPEDMECSRGMHASIILTFGFDNLVWVLRGMW